MSIGIGISVDARQVKAAKASVEELNSALHQTEAMPDLLPGSKHLANVSGLVKNVAADIQRMQGLARAGERKGGMLDARQFSEAEKISKRLLETFGAYVGKVSLARDELKKLIAEKERLERKEFESGRLDPFERSRVEELEKEIVRRNRLVNRHSERVEEMRANLNAANESVGGYGMAPDQQGGGGLLGGMSMRSLMTGAFAGAVGIYAFSKAKQMLSEGMNIAESFNRAEVDMLRRGVTGTRDNIVSYGFTPQEHIDMFNAVLSRGGYANSEVVEAAKAFSRGRGVSDASATNFMGTYAAYTGADSKRLADSMEKLRGALITGNVNGRAEEFMSRNVQLLTRIAEGSGGAMSGRGADYITGLQAAMWAGNSPVGKGQSGASMISAMNDFISGGGSSPGEQVALWQALGGNGITSPDDLWGLKERMARGIKDPNNVVALFDWVKNTYGTDDDGRVSSIGKMALQEMLGKHGMRPDQINKLVELDASGKLTAAGASRYTGAGGSIYGDASEAMAHLGNYDREMKAQVQLRELEAGEPILRTADAIREVGVQIYDNVHKALKDVMDPGVKVHLTDEDRMNLSVPGSYPYKTPDVNPGSRE